MDSVIDTGMIDECITSIKRATLQCPIDDEFMVGFEFALHLCLFKLQLGNGCGDDGDEEWLALPWLSLSTIGTSGHPSRSC